MTSATQGILIHTLCSVLSALAFHWTVRRYVAASLLAAIVANVAFNVIVYLIEGTLDKFFLVAVFVGFFVSLVIAMVIGFVFVLVRPKRSQHIDIV